MNCTRIDKSSGFNITAPCNNVVGSPNFYTGTVQMDAYQYEVNQASAYAFVILFGIATVGHVLLGVFWKSWWAIATLAFGAAIECVGWSGRLWSCVTKVWDPNGGGTWSSADGAFTMQIVCLVFAPTFFSAANYITLGRLVRKAGGQYCSLSPRSFSVLFTCADVICLVIQGIGGGVVGGADTTDRLKTGLKIMAIGVIIQLVLTGVFAGFLFEFWYRFTKNTPSTRSIDLIKPFICCGKRRKSTDEPIKLDERSSSQRTTSAPGPDGLDGDIGITSTSRRMILIMNGTLALATLLILVRSIYRADELLTFNGVSGGTYSNQAIFIGMDGSLMLILVIMYLILHPGTIDGRKLF